MNKEISKFLTKYKKFIVPVSLNLLSVIIIFGVILPQFSAISDQLQNIKTQGAQIISLKNTFATINSQSDSDLDANFSTATQALPSDKQIAVLFAALSSAAVDSNTTLQDFSLTVGGIFGRAAIALPGETSAPSIGVQASVTGPDAQSLVEFTKLIQQKLPLSEVTTINIIDNTGTFEINFFYKPYDSAQIAVQQSVKSINQSDANLLGQLKGWSQ